MIVPCVRTVSANASNAYIKMRRMLSPFRYPGHLSLAISCLDCLDSAQQIEVVTFGAYPAASEAGTPNHRHSSAVNRKDDKNAVFIEGKLLPETKECSSRAALSLIDARRSTKTIFLILFRAGSLPPARASAAPLRDVPLVR
jgi:hypothetical protein